MADLGDDEDAGAVYAFERIDGLWREVQKLIASNGDDGDFFGDRVAIDGDMILVGEPENDDKDPSGGAVYAFERIDGVWQEVQIIYPDDPSTSQVFGRDIALDGDRAFIGAIQDSQVNTFSGATYVFERQDNEWVQVDKLLPLVSADNDALGSFFGTEIDLDGDRVIIGALTDDAAAAADFVGSASVFEFESGQWQLVDKLLPPPVEEPDLIDQDLFSIDLALSGDWALVGSLDDERCIENTMLDPNLCDAGAVFAYQRQDDDDWELQQKIAPVDLGDRDFFGRAIAMEGSRAVFGAFGDDDACPDQPPSLFCDPGAVYLFELIDGQWQPVDKFTASDADSTDFLGVAVATSSLEPQAVPPTVIPNRTSVRLTSSKSSTEIP